MTETFIDVLRKEKNVFDMISSVCKVTIMPVFIDLVWEGNYDMQEGFRDPGVQIDKQQKRLVLERINGEIRYYAGVSDPYSEDYRFELGVFPNESIALAFAYEYLVNQCPLSEIATERTVRSSSGPPSA